MFGGKVVQSYTYELKSRAAGSANRTGFNSTDVLYLIMPDRFANGDPTNDSKPEMADKLNKADQYGRHGGDIKGMIDHPRLCGRSGIQRPMAQSCTGK